jgi:hypothetical protein
MVSAAGKNMPVLVSPVGKRAGEAAEPAGSIRTLVAEERTYAATTETSALRDAPFWLISNWLVAETAVAVVSWEILIKGIEGASV